MKLRLALAWRREVAERTMSFACDFEGQSFPFKAGQCVQITPAAPRYLHEEGNSRSFSIASSPDDPFVLMATRFGSVCKRNGHSAEAAVPVDTDLLEQDSKRRAVPG